MSDSAPITDLPANMDLLFGSSEYQDKYMSKLRELARQHNQDLCMKSDKPCPTSITQSISPTPSTASSSCGSPIRHFKKSLIVQSNLDGDFDSDDDEKGQLSIVSDGAMSIASSIDSKPHSEHMSTGKIDFSIKSLTSSNNNSSCKYDSEDDEDDSHNQSSISIKTDNNELVKSDQIEDHEIKSEDDLHRITPEQFDFLRPSTLSWPGPSPNTSFGTMPLPFPSLAPTHIGRRPLNGPPCSLQTLVDDQILDPLDGALTYEVKGTKFVGDLLPSGFIRMSGSEQVFANPVKWANFCRTLALASCTESDQKNYGNAWSMILYCGKRLDSFKLRWYRKQKKQQGNVCKSSSSVQPKNRSRGRESSNGINLYGAYQTQMMLNNLQSNMNRNRLWKLDKVSTGDMELANEHINDENVINFSSIDLKNKDATCLGGDIQVGAVPFNQIYCLQPFKVNLATNALLLIDFHSHLATIELSGYLGGTWDHRTQILTINQAYPLKYTESEAEIEKQTLKIKENILEKGWILVGWYHTHPDKGPHPTVNDVKRQLEFQKTMLTSNKKKKGDTLPFDYSPVVGLIVSPYHQRTNNKLTSLLQMFWVMPLFVSNCQRDFGRPMQISYSVQRDAFLTQDLLVEMRQCATALANHPKFVQFRDEFRCGASLWDKVYASLQDKLPRDLIVDANSVTVQNDIQQQALSHFWTFLKALLLGPN